jgi:hypothetical protein
MNHGAPNYRQCSEIQLRLQLSQFSDYTTGWTIGLNSRQMQGFLSSPPRPDRRWGPFSYIVGSGSSYPGGGV